MRGIRDEDSTSDGFEIEDCKAVAETDLALRVTGVHSDDPSRAEWMPKSVVHEDSEVYTKGNEGKLVVKTWFAKREGWM